MADMFAKLWREALERRATLIEELINEGTNAYRLFLGNNEGRAGLTVDRFGDLLLAQVFFEPLNEDEVYCLKEYAARNSLYLVIWPKYDRQIMKERSKLARESLVRKEFHTCYEEGQKFFISPFSCGYDPYIYLDFRCGRRWLRKEVKFRLQDSCNDVSVLNLFAYTCSAGIACASLSSRVKVTNVDFGSWCLDIGRLNAQLNGIEDKNFRIWHEDFFPIMRQLSGLGLKGRAARHKYKRVEEEKFDIIVLDPPTVAKSVFGKVDIVNDYQALFKPCLLSLKKGGAILAVNHSSEVSLERWQEELYRCANKAGVSWQDCQLINLEGDFPSFDAKHPVKVVVVRI